MNIEEHKDINIVLDLDQSMICSEDFKEFDTIKYKNKMKNFAYEDFDKDYRIFERPNLQIFLDYLFANFNVSVWTAASKDYALFIIDKIILRNKSRKLDHILFGYHCDISDNVKGNTKNLSMFEDYFKGSKYREDNTYIIDDYIEVYNTQPDHCFLIKPFEFTKRYSEYDDELLKMMKKLRKLKIKKNKK